jgi:hypothetical protein
MAGHRRMSLQGKRASRQPVHPGRKLMLDVSVGKPVLDHGLAVKFDREQPIPADDFLGVPDIVRDRRFRQDGDHLLVVRGRCFRAPGDIPDAI